MSGQQTKVQATCFRRWDFFTWLKLQHVACTKLVRPWAGSMLQNFTAHSTLLMKPWVESMWHRLQSDQCRLSNQMVDSLIQITQLLDHFTLSCNFQTLWQQKGVYPLSRSMNPSPHRSPFYQNWRPFQWLGVNIQLVEHKVASSGKKSVMCLIGGQTKHSPQKQIVSRSGYKKNNW